ncbi:MAG: hypothetical protein CM1200mP29_08460 [Verrucomicrobiota bacterium]|nr:MAG: hypothetical protein CM1200mP29_08460 [Verrucomicrobiota bacterium]
MQGLFYRCFGKVEKRSPYSIHPQRTRRATEKKNPKGILSLRLKILLEEWIKNFDGYGKGIGVF